MASLPTTCSSRFRHSESSVYAAATRSGSRAFHASSAACTFWRAVSSVNGGTGGRGSILCSWVQHGFPHLIHGEDAWGLAIAYAVLPWPADVGTGEDGYGCREATT